MDMPDVLTLTPDELKLYIEKHLEKDYLLIDVRQPEEYEEGHIPGATLLPMMALETKLFGLPQDKDLIFYCRSGSRSQVAGILAVDAEVSEKRIHHLGGGILGWHGRTLSDYPKIQAFDKSKTLSGLLLTAMEMEKGASRFYTTVCDKFSNQPFAEILEGMAQAEIGHARTVYRFCRDLQRSPKSFEEIFQGLKGDILEGGGSAEEMIRHIEAIAENPCIQVIETALDIEYSAFDLYRTMADKIEDDIAKTAFISLAQAEKAHMRVLVRALDRCQPE
jgi:sulfur-carrier protein adenylyltransferase/sulfurtransferase